MTDQARLTASPSTGSGLHDAVLDTVRLTDQFLGELNPYTSKGKQFQSGVNQIVFSDGVIWDRFRMAMQVADPRATNDVYAGSGSGDVLWGGKGNDVMTGGLGGGRVGRKSEIAASNDDRADIWGQAA